jgi:hypothetical protein
MVIETSVVSDDECCTVDTVATPSGLLVDSGR